MFVSRTYEDSLYLERKAKNQNEVVFFHACLYEDLKTVKEIAVKYPKVIKNIVGFWTACFYNHIDIVEFLVEICKINIHDVDEMGLVLACQEGNFETVQYLVEECGADIHAKNERPFRIACSHNRELIARYLFEYSKKSGNKIDIHAKRNQVFREACWGNKDFIQEYLIEIIPIDYVERYYDIINHRNDKLKNYYDLKQLLDIKVYNEQIRQKTTVFLKYTKIPPEIFRNILIYLIV